MRTKNVTMLPKGKKEFPKLKGVVSSEVKDWGSDPFILKGVENARKMIAKYGLPKEWVEEAKRNNDKKEGKSH